MPRFTIVSPGRAEPISELVARDPGGVLNMMSRLGCLEADILRDGDYSFSARLDANGVWAISDRRGRDRYPGGNSAAEPDEVK